MRRSKGCFLFLCVLSWCTVRKLGFHCSTLGFCRGGRSWWTFLDSMSYSTKKTWVVCKLTCLFSSGEFAIFSYFDIQVWHFLVGVLRWGFRVMWNKQFLLMFVLIVILIWRRGELLILSFFGFLQRLTTSFLSGLLFLFPITTIDLLS